MYFYKTYLKPFFKKTYINYSLIASLYAFSITLVVIKAFLFSFCFKLKRLYILELLLFLRLLILLTLLVMLLILLVTIFILKF